MTTFHPLSKDFVLLLVPLLPFPPSVIFHNSEFKKLKILTRKKAHQYRYKHQSSFITSHHIIIQEVIGSINLLAAMSLKEEKEAFVAGHKGTTASEILLVCISAPIGIFLYHELNYYTTHRGHTRTKTPTSASGRRSLSLKMGVFLEAVTILLPMAICQTKLLHPYGVMLLAFEACLAIVLHLQRTQLSLVPNPNTCKGGKDDHEQLQLPDKDKRGEKLDFLTFYRSTVSYLTFVAILAVDFPIFPRSFAKTEVSGYGLMDLGAGSFCISGGLVSWFARRRRKMTTRTSDSSEALHVVRDTQRFRIVMIRCLPLLVMGFIRFFTTKGLEYQEHVSEYGVHWNFFFTLSLVGVLSTFLRAILRMENSAWWIMCLVCYQILLSHEGTDVQLYIEKAPRRCDLDGSTLRASLCNFFAANREGILGCIGYLILHLAGEDIAHYCLWDSQGNFSQRRRGKQIACVTTLFWSLHWLLVSFFGIPVSRRSTNASFVVWTIAHNMTILFATWTAFYLGCPSKQKDASDSEIPIEVNPPIFAAVNRHGLIVFILANLMTGAVNLSIDTLKVSDATAIAVIFVYLCAIGAVGLLLDYKPHRKGKVR